MTAHALLLAILILICAIIEIHPRIPTGPLASLTLGAIAIAAALRIVMAPPSPSLAEYIAIGIAIYASLAFALLRRHNHDRPARQLTPHCRYPTP